MKKLPADYDAIHWWLRNKHGRASKCENDSCKGESKNYEWSKLKGKRYLRIRENYWQLCKSCHRDYDITQKTREIMRKKSTGKIKSEATRRKISDGHRGQLRIKMRKVVYQYSLDGEFIKKWESLTSAAKVGLYSGSITSVCRGRMKTCGGYRWSYDYFPKLHVIREQYENTR